MVTSRDVARLAGVSQATVSRVIQGRSNVLPATRERVESALKDLEYVPNAMARAMRTQRSGIVGVVVARLTNPFFPQLLDGLREALSDAGKMMFLWSSDGQGDRAVLAAFKGMSLDSVIFTTAQSDSRALFEAIELEVPMVLINRSIEWVRCDQITSDNASGGATVAEYFVENGRTRVGLVGGDPRTSTGMERSLGFTSKMEELGHPLPASMNHTCDFTHEAGMLAAQAMLRDKTPPSAIFCANDLLAFGALSAAAADGLRVPDDLWVVGYDDIDMASWPIFDLSTIRQPTTDMARAAVAALVERAEDPSRPFRHMRFASELIVRGSTANIPKSNATEREAPSVFAVGDGFAHA
jgi:LacI family transcriptional regulator